MRKVTFFKLYFIFIVLCIYNTNGSANNKLFLLPQENEKALQSILDNFDLAKNSIKISIYNFTHKQIAKRLKKAAKRGVKVEIIFDEGSSIQQKEKSMLYYLAKYKNITVYQLKGKPSKRSRYDGIMHMKTAVIDNKVIIFGSANWSYSAFSKNYELLYVTKNYALAKKFLKFFDTMKQQSKLYH